MKSNWGAPFTFLEIVNDHSFSIFSVKKASRQIVIENQKIPYVEAHLVSICLKLDISYAYV